MVNPLNQFHQYTRMIQLWKHYDTVTESCERQLHDTDYTRLC